MKSNFHTHTRYCDGGGTCEEIVLKAIEKGFTAIGFSGHSYTPFADDYCMSEANTVVYKNEVEALKDKYKGQINIYCGLEHDYYSSDAPGGWDYKIGSVHFLFKDGRYICTDGSGGNVKNAVENYYGGDYYAYAEHYFKSMSDVVNKTNCDIIAHFNLITKFNENGDMFDVNNPRYKKAWKKALDILTKTGRVFEVNTGAMSRGYMKTIYPSLEMLEYIADKGGKVIVTTDCHDPNKLDFGADKAYELIERSGVCCVDFEDILKEKNKII